jgi:hypothetical protein
VLISPRPSFIHPNVKTVGKKRKMSSESEISPRVEIPHDLLGREIDLGEVTVTREMIASYVRSVGDDTSLAGSPDEAPPTFCLTLRRGMTPDIPLPPGTFGVYGGHDLEFLQPIRAGRRYLISARVVDVFEKSGRSGHLTVVVREATVRDEEGNPAVRISEREIIRARPPSPS